MVLRADFAVSGKGSEVGGVRVDLKLTVIKSLQVKWL